MPHAPLTSEELQRRGEELYRDLIKAQVETDENIGKFLAIDVESGDYELGDMRQIVDVALRLRARHPNRVFWGKKIGYDAVYSFGGSLSRTDR